MSITAARSATAAQTAGAAYETCFESGDGNQGSPATTIGCWCDTGAAIFRINGGAEFRVEPGDPQYRRIGVMGITKLEVKHAGSAATVRWDVDVVKS